MKENIRSYYDNYSDLMKYRLHKFVESDLGAPENDESMSDTNISLNNVSK